MAGSGPNWGAPNLVDFGPKMRSKRLALNMRRLLAKLAGLRPRSAQCWPNSVRIRRTSGSTVGGLGDQSQSKAPWAPATYNGSARVDRRQRAYTSSSFQYLWPCTNHPSLLAPLAPGLCWWKERNDPLMPRPTGKYTQRGIKMVLRRAPSIAGKMVEKRSREHFPVAQIRPKLVEVWPCLAKICQLRSHVRA